MIISKLQGGHSNQLFQYAIGRQLAKSLGTKLVLDLSWFKEIADVDTSRFYELDCYPLQATTRENLSGLRVVDTHLPVSKIEKAKRKYHLGNSIWTYYEQGIGYNAGALSQPDNTLLVGYWQTEKYFTGIRDEILSTFEPTTPPNPKNTAIIRRIQDSESVWMHIRRGDYVTNENANKFHGLKDLQYYQQALDILVKKLPKDRAKQLEIFVCSNDIPWCKQNLKFPYPITFVENEAGSDDMRVIKHCKHDIIANSSFSWWGAWLNENPAKIVVAPKVWFQDKQANGQTEIVPAEWIRL